MFLQYIFLFMFYCANAYPVPMTTTFATTTFAPTTFATTTFAPTTFAPTTFAPTTFAPTTFAPTTFAQDIPIVVLHGIASSAPNMDVLSEWLENTFDREVFNIEIGNGVQNSVFMPLHKQLDILCDTIYDIPELQDGFDFIGMSQGGLLARGYLENCNGYPVRNLINLASPNGGVVEYTSLNMYSDFNQEHLSISGYWRDPLELDEYLNKCSYLPFLNNERMHQLSTHYKERIISLKNYIVIWSPFDDVINPPESAKFSFFDEEYNIIPLRETLLYKEDTLGLRTLDEDNRFHIYETNCTHVQHRDPVCFMQLYEILDKYLALFRKVQQK